MFSTLIVGIIFTKVNMYFGLIGGTLGVLMAHGIPAFCVMKLIKINDYDFKVLIFAAIMSVFCVIGAVLSVIDPA